MTPTHVLRETRPPYGAPDPAPPAYVLSLTVAGLRCFGPEQTLDLTDGQGRPARWTVLLGDNGTGKTTLLQCLAMMRPERAFQPLATRDLWSPRVDPDLLLEWRRADHPALSIDARLQVGATLRDADGGRVVETWGVGLGDEPRGELQLARVGTAEDVGGLMICAYGAARRMGNSALSESGEDDAVGSLFSDERPLLNAEEWLLQADYAALADSPGQEQARRRRDQVRELLLALLPDVSDLRFVRPVGHRLGARVEVLTPFGWVRIQHLSLGYRALIAWIVDLAYRLFERYPRSANPLAMPAVVLVDEIDLHLHPRWQRSIVQYLTERFPATQFVVAAHGPLIVQSAPNANLVLLRREGDHVVVDNDVEAIRGWRIDQVLTSDLFGLESARPSELEPLLAERKGILAKSALTPADEQRLDELDRRIGVLPTGETPADIEAMEVIRRAADAVRRGAAGGT